MLSRSRLLFIAAVLFALVPLMLRSGLGLFVVPPYAVVGAILVMRRPANPIGWIVLLSGAAFAILLTRRSTRRPPNSSTARRRQSNRPSPS